MKKVTLLLASLFLVACGHDWSEGDEKDFMDNCKDGPGDNSTDYCECLWDIQTSHFNSEEEMDAFEKRQKDDELEDSDFDLMRSAGKDFIDCTEDDKLRFRM